MNPSSSCLTVATLFENFFYQNQSLLLGNENPLQDNCPRSLHNIAFYRTPFYARSHIFFNCTAQFSGSDPHFPIPCVSNETHHSFAAIGSGKPSTDMINFAGSCVSDAAVPFLMGTDEKEVREGHYKEVMEKGFLLQWAANNCSECAASGGRCGFDISVSQFVYFCHDRSYRVKCNGRALPLREGRDGIMKRSMGAPAIVAVLVVGTILLFACLAICGKFFRCPTRRIWKTRTSVSRNVEDFLNNHGPLALKRYGYLDVKKMTNSFKCKLGEGAYGSVFKGKNADGRPVAVKLLIESKGNGEEFINEVSSIGRTYHVNIVTLLGFCSSGPKRALVYEFMPNGSLDKFIYAQEGGTPNHLGWEKLYQIALGIARGLEYLHRGCNTRILHFDIKPQNILLDHDFSPKISDFGLAKLCPTKDSIISMAGARGTVGYIAPEVFCRNIGGVSSKSDVYSYGMMVLEMVGERKNLDAHIENVSEIYFPHYIYKCVDLKVDLGLHGIVREEDERNARKMIMVGLWCIQTDPTRRPSMSRVMEMLEGSLEGLEMPPKPYLSSPDRTTLQEGVTSYNQISL